MTMEDAELLRRYAEEGSEEAFAELVRRHLSLVYYAAMRQLGGDAHRAEEVAQSVFTDLARKAKSLGRHSALSGWLYTSTHYAAAKTLREAQRRQVREEEAQTMQELLHESEPEADWDKLRPVIDRVLLEMSEKDRQAILLRFFEGRAFAEVGTALGLSDDAARMRVERALGKMRMLLGKHRITSTSAALAAALAAQASLAAPAGLTTSITGLALSGAAVSTGAGSFLIFMSMSKIQIGLAAALIAAGGAGVALQSKEAKRLNAELEVLRAEQIEIAELRSETARLDKRAQETTHLRLANAELPRLRELAAARNAGSGVARVMKGEGGQGSGAEAPAEKSYSFTDLDVKPRILKQAPPIYPLPLRLDGEKGQVQVSFIVDSNGDVTNEKAVKSSDPDFEDAALKAVKLWKFSPGKKDGNAVPVRIQVPIVFSLQDQPAK